LHYTVGQKYGHSLLISYLMGLLTSLEYTDAKLVLIYF
jgi:hypothetical protein